MRLASWNVNSLRSRHAQLLTWLVERAPDVVALQETKARREQLLLEEFAELGYAVAHHGVDHWNGVAILSRVGLDHVVEGFSTPVVAPFDEPRLLTATCGGVRVASIYVPNGRTLDDPHYRFKLDWLARLRLHLEAELRSGLPLLAMGDFNVAPTDQDLYDPRRFRRTTHATPAERAALIALTDLGLVDLLRAGDAGDGLFTWWNYRPGQFEANRGLRIDHVLADRRTAARVTRCWVDRQARAVARASDHAPVIVDLAGPG